MTVERVEMLREVGVVDAGGGGNNGDGVVGNVGETGGRKKVVELEDWNGSIGIYMEWEGFGENGGEDEDITWRYERDDGGNTLEEVFERRRKLRIPQPLAVP